MLVPLVDKLVLPPLDATLSESLADVVPALLVLLVNKALLDVLHVSLPVDVASVVHWRHGRDMGLKLVRATLFMSDKGIFIG